jgi:hypothetical protein
MNKSNMQNQREIDEAAEIENRTEELAIEMTSALASGEDFHLETVDGYNSFGAYEVVEAMRTIEPEIFYDSVFALNGAAKKSLAKLKVEAITEVVKDAPLVDAVIFERKQMERAA